MSEIRAGTIANEAGTGPIDLVSQWAARLAVGYSQSTPAVINSENVTSVTDNGAGDYTVVATNNFASADEPMVTTTCAQSTSGNGVSHGTSNGGITSTGYNAVTDVSGRSDRGYNGGIVIGDLA